MAVNQVIWDMIYSYITLFVVYTTIKDINVHTVVYTAMKDINVHTEIDVNRISEHACGFLHRLLSACVDFVSSAPRDDNLYRLLNH